MRGQSIIVSSKKKQNFLPVNGRYSKGLLMRFVFLLNVWKKP